ncbi:MAG TPA: HEAT repeat domain-containing protein, partial [Chloroflexia bacterium]|nr:HEAT repeat domain-containing protein [Chloroflexia bacterium]
MMMRITGRSLPWYGLAGSWGLSLILAVVITACTSASADDKEVKTMNDGCAEARLWMNARPFQDEPQWVTPQPTEYTSNTWEGWLAKGKGISNLEECLLSMLENEEDAVTRSASAMALGYVGGESSVQPLINALDSDIPLVQMEAAASLGNLGKSEAVEPLCNATKNSDSNVRANACMALGRIGGERARTCL